MFRLPRRGICSPGDGKISGILIGPRLGVLSGEWKGLDWSLNKGAAIARFELVRTIGGPTGPKGEADLGGSIGTSRQGSLGENVGSADVRDGDAARGDGLKVAALAFSIRGEEMGDPVDGSASCDELAKPDGPCGSVGVCEPDPEGD